MKMNAYQHYKIALIIFIPSFLFFLYKVIFLKFPLVPNKDAVSYTIEARLSFKPRYKTPIRIKMYLPQSKDSFVIVDENFLKKGAYGEAINKVGDNRMINWTKSEASGEQYFFYRAVVQESSSYSDSKEIKKPSFAVNEFIGSQVLAANALIEHAKARSADEESFIYELIKVILGNSYEQELNHLLEGDHSELKKVELAVSLLNMVKIPARVVHGVELKSEARDVKLQHWFEVFSKNRVSNYRMNSKEYKVPYNYFPWYRGKNSLAYISGGTNMHISISIRKNVESEISNVVSEERIKRPTLYKFSLFNLPLDMQRVFQILLLFPLGAIVVVIMRNIVGLNSLGTFIPVLIAISFRETRLINGILLFSVIIFFGLSVRFFLDRLKLLLVPRLTVVLSSIIVFILLTSMLMHNLGYERNVSVALFPIIILTMVIERLSIIWEEQGSTKAIKLCISTLLIATVIYVIITNPIASHLVFVFPELSLCFIAIALSLGRYTGYRLSECFRFASLLD
ncbi:MAG: UUP1 family membrane protein [Bdellovibrionota bacterium]